MVRVVRAGTGDDREIVGALAHGKFDHREVLLVGERRSLAGRAGDDHAIAAGGGQVFEDANERSLVHGAVGVERGDHSGQDCSKFRHATSIRAAL